MVTVEVPRQAPTQVAMASAIRARSPPGMLPSLSSMPLLPAVPSRVPTVSNISTTAKLMIAVIKGSRPWVIRPAKSNLNRGGGDVDVADGQAGGESGSHPWGYR